MKRDFIAAGVINAITSAFATHPEIAFSACMALRLLADGNDEICEAVVASGAIGPTVTSLSMCTGLTTEIDLFDKDAACSLLKTLGFDDDGSPKLITCLSGHPLHPTRHRPEYDCSLCRLTVPDGSVMMHCRVCDFDVCSDCNSGPKLFSKAEWLD